MNHISSHADYRRKDYFFEREQSRTLKALEWEKSEAPFRSWSELVYPAVATMGALAALIEIIH